MNRQYLYRTYNRLHPQTGQQGATLAIVLIFLVLVTLVGVTAMTTTTLEERMAGNLKDQNLAFQAAEAGLRDAKLDISGGKVVATATPRSSLISGATGFGDAASTFPSCSTATTGPTVGLCLPSSLSYPASALNSTWVQSQSFTAAPSIEYGTYTGAVALKNVFRQPRYLIEAVQVCEGGGKCPSWMYRITARGYGARDETRVTLQEVVRAP